MENKGNFSYIIKDGDKSTQEQIFKKATEKVKIIHSSLLTFTSLPATNKDDPHSCSVLELTVSCDYVFVTSKNLLHGNKR